MYSKDQIIAAARKRGMSEEQIQRMMKAAPKVAAAGLLKIGKDGCMNLTAKGRENVRVLKAAGKIPG
jgi:hypothetical protein